MSVSFTDDHKIVIDAIDEENIKAAMLRSVYTDCSAFRAFDGVCISCPHYIVPIGCTIGEPYKNWKGWEEV